MAKKLHKRWKIISPFDVSISRALYDPFKCMTCLLADCNKFIGGPCQTNDFSLFSQQVFHVCALTDDGLIMKSFLCPESTLFDQTILKCNWWFYTDCGASKSLYDSNLPVSKSYQLMKSLSYFNKNYKNSQNATLTAAEKAVEAQPEVEKVSIVTAKDKQ